LHDGRQFLRHCAVQAGLQGQQDQNMQDHNTGQTHELAPRSGLKVSACGHWFIAGGVRASILKEESCPRSSRFAKNQKGAMGLIRLFSLAHNLPSTSFCREAAQPSGRNALAILRFFEGELAIVQVGDHGMLLVA
jgi:hypothetical protein